MDWLNGDKKLPSRAGQGHDGRTNKHMENTSNRPNWQAGYVKMMRTPDTFELIETWPLAFTLAATIALRARFQSGVSLKGLHPGECFLGDFERCGMSRQQYRTALAKLCEWRFVTIKVTTKGTVARLVDTRLFDVLNVTANQQTNQQLTTGQPLTEPVKNGEPLEKKKKPVPKFREIREYAEAIGAADPEEAARGFFDHHEAHGWQITGKWEAYLRGYIRKGRTLSRTQRPGRHPRPERDPLSGPELDMSTLGRGNL